MEQNWAEFKGLFTDILANEKFANSLLTKDFLQLKLKAGAKTKVHSTFGLCYVLSECAYYMLGGKEEGWKPMFMKHLGCSHWFLKHETGFVLDLSEEQFNTPPDHDRAVGKGFMTKQPCKRSKILLKRIQSNVTYINSNFPGPEALDARMDDLILSSIEAAPEKLQKLGLGPTLDDESRDWLTRYDSLLV